jgi:hypothetical protein
MLPLDGSIFEHVPAIVAAYEKIVPQKEWPSVTAIDFTAGSCLLPLILAAGGVARLSVNDAAERTQVAALALFGGHELDWSVVRRLLTARRPTLQPHIPSFAFASDYFTEAACDVFDRLFFAKLPSAAAPAYRYLALRWMQGFAPHAEEEFNILPTHDLRQLRDETGLDWSPYIRRLRQRDMVLRALIKDINAGIRLVRGCPTQVYRADLLALLNKVQYGRRTLIVSNPPTNGLDEYTIDDQLLHSLIANRWLPLSKSRESESEFWIRRTEAVLRRAPRGSHIVMWGGDGVLGWKQCWKIWMRYARPLISKKIGRGRHSPVWVILEKK